MNKNQQKHKKKQKKKTIPSPQTVKKQNKQKQ